MTKHRIPHNRPTLGKEEQQAAMQVLQSGWVAQGTAVEQFENEFCHYVGLPPGLAVAVSSGTAALFLALEALGAKGKTIALPAYSCASLRHATTLAGGNTLFVDSDGHSPNIQLEAIDAATHIAIIPHLHGIPQAFSKEASDTLLIEDCAQSLGARVNGVSTGLQGHVGIFSFYATKLMTSGGQGGMIVSEDRSIIEQLKDYRLHDQKFDTKNRFNFQMTDLQAAIGRAQLRKLPAFLKRREAIFQQYEEANFPLLKASPGIQPVHFRAILQTSKQQEIITALAKYNITGTVPVQDWTFPHAQAYFPNATYWHHNTVSLPIFPSLSEEEVGRVIQVVKGVL